MEAFVLSALILVLSSSSHANGGERPDTLKCISAATPKIVYDPVEMRRTGLAEPERLRRQSHVARVQKVIEKLRSNSLSKFRLPDYIEYASSKNDQPVYESETFRIYNFPDAHTSSDSEAIDAHEIAHAVFDMNMRDFSIEWQNWSTQREKFKEFYLDLAQIYALRRDLLDERTLIRGDDARSWRLSEINLELGKIERHIYVQTGGWFSKIPAIYQLSRPYQELFADLIGALHLEDFAKYGELLVRIFDRTSKIHYIDRIQTYNRGFTGSVNLDFDQWNQLMKVSRDRDHILLNPARRFLYLTYFKGNGKARADLGAFTYSVFRSIALEIVYQNSNPNWKLLTAEEVNRSLIRRFELELKEFQ